MPAFERWSTTSSIHPRLLRDDNLRTIHQEFAAPRGAITDLATPCLVLQPHFGGSWPEDRRR